MLLPRLGSSMPGLWTPQEAEWEAVAATLAEVSRAGRRRGELDGGPPALRSKVEST